MTTAPLVIITQITWNSKNGVVKFVIWAMKVLNSKSIRFNINICKSNITKINPLWKNKSLIPKSVDVIDEIAELYSTKKNLKGTYLVKSRIKTKKLINAFCYTIGKLVCSLLCVCLCINSHNILCSWWSNKTSPLWVFCYKNYNSIVSKASMI